MNDPYEFPNDQGDLAELAARIRSLPYLDPPEGFAGSVMARIGRQRLPWWKALYRWARAPRRVVFTPLQAASLAAALSLLVVLGVHLFPGSPSNPQPGEMLPTGLPVTLTLKTPEAGSVSVVGTFNGWQGKGFEMLKDPSANAWVLVLKLPAGRYEYAFLIDGKKLVADPQAVFFQDDGFGNQNSVLIVGNQHEDAI